MKINNSNSVTKFNELTPLRKWESSEDFAEYCTYVDTLNRSIKPKGETRDKIDYKLKFEQALEDNGISLKDALNVTSYMAYIDTSFEHESETYNYNVMRLHSESMDKKEALQKMWILNSIFG